MNIKNEKDKINMIVEIEMRFVSEPQFFLGVAKL